MTRGPATGLLVALAMGFAALGVWQVERRAWKLALIAAVDARVRAAPVAAPPPEIDVADAAYTRVRATGTFDASRRLLVQAVTERGPGFWLIVPLRTPGGWTVLVNRGFVPTATTPVTAPVVPVTGLLRLTEPDGGFLRANDPAAGRWFSRDVVAMARAEGLIRVAPYFIDADGGAPGYPIGGLTVVRFRNTHLVYALTWFSLAALALWGAWRVGCER